MSDVAISIRPARAVDVPVLGQLGALLVALHHDLDPERFLAPGPSTAQSYGRYLESVLGDEDVIVLVAEVDGVVAGYAYAALESTDWMSLRGPAGVIHDLVVDPGRRRSGIGRLLLEHTLTSLAERGAPRIVLATAERNAAARALFASARFRPTMIEMTREPAG